MGNVAWGQRWSLCALDATATATATAIPTEALVLLARAAMLNPERNRPVSATFPDPEWLYLAEWEGQDFFLSVPPS